MEILTKDLRKINRRDIEQAKVRIIVGCMVLLILFILVAVNWGRYQLYMTTQ